MRALVLILVSISLMAIHTGVAAANSAPVVSDVNALQRDDGSGVVDIYYTMDDPDANSCAVSIEVSDDGGVSWNVVATDLSGDIGADVPDGVRHIVWNSKTDLPGAYGTNYQVKVIADDGVFDGPIDIVFVTIPGGTFQMGDAFDDETIFFDELPIHAVTLDSFEMSKYETTNNQYCEYLNAALTDELIMVHENIVYAVSDANYLEPYFDTHAADSESQIDYNSGVFVVRSKKGRSMINDPVVEVSWYGAMAFCDYYGYYLPSEAQWEYAARGGFGGRRFPWGDTIGHSHANYYSNGTYFYDVSPTRDFHPDWDEGIPYTSVVGSFPANGYGLCDMIGNVWEWCHDWFDDCYYEVSPTSNPMGPAVGSHRVVRSGSWTSDTSFSRVACRHKNEPFVKNGSRGFRVCR